MGMYTQEKKKIIIDTIGENKNLTNNEIASILNNKGIKISAETVRDYKQAHYPETCNKGYMSTPFVKNAISCKRKVTHLELLGVFDMPINQTYALAKRINAKIDALIIEESGINGVKAKTGIITRKGNLTVHKMF